MNSPSSVSMSPTAPSRLGYFSTLLSLLKPIAARFGIRSSGGPLISQLEAKPGASDAVAAARTEARRVAGNLRPGARPASAPLVVAASSKAAENGPVDEVTRLRAVVASLGLSPSVTAREATSELEAVVRLAAGTPSPGTRPPSSSMKTDQKPSTPSTSAATAPTSAALGLNQPPPIEQPVELQSRPGTAADALVADLRYSRDPERRREALRRYVEAFRVEAILDLLSDEELSAAIRLEPDRSVRDRLASVSCDRRAQRRG